MDINNKIKWKIFKILGDLQLIGIGDVVSKNFVGATGMETIRIVGLDLSNQWFTNL